MSQDNKATDELVKVSQENARKGQQMIDEANKKFSPEQQMRMGVQTGQMQGDLMNAISSREQSSAQRRQGLSRGAAGALAASQQANQETTGNAQGYAQGNQQVESARNTMQQGGQNLVGTGTSGLATGQNLQKSPWDKVMNGLSQGGGLLGVITSDETAKDIKYPSYNKVYTSRMKQLKDKRKN